MFSGIKRDDSAKFIKNNSDGTSTTLTDIEVIIPVRFSNIGFVNISTDVKLVSILAIRSGNVYKTIVFPVFISFVPHKTETVTYKGVDYYVFHVAKGMPFANRLVVQSTEIIKPYVEEGLIKGNIPFYLTDTDVRESYNRFYEYCGSTLGDDVVIMSILVSILTRSFSDHTLPWRLSDKKTDKINFVGINDVGLSRNDGFSQMTGAYMREGLVGASLRIKDDPTEIEKILK